MKIDTIKTSFTSGELGPSLLGRVQIAQYPNACETIRNMLCRPYGPLVSTPGTEYISDVKGSGAGTASTTRVRVIDFVFSRTDAFIIELGVSYFRFYTDGAQIES